MTEPAKKKLPDPVYAAVGAGDLAYQKLRKLPGILGGWTGKAAAGTADLRGKARSNSAGLRGKAVAGTAELRRATRRSTVAVAAGAHVVQQKTTAVYGDLVAHGAEVMGRPAGPAPAVAELGSAGAAPALPTPRVAPDTAAAPDTTAPDTAAKPVKKTAKRTGPTAGT